MNKRFAIVVLAVVMLVACFVGMTACKPDEPQNLDHTHAWENWVSDNATTHSRSCACGESETKNHSFGSWISVDEQAHSHECSVCGLIIKENHRWDSGTITNSADCKNDGLRTYTCLDCGKTRTETIDKNNNHTWGNWTTNGEATHSRVCSTCDEREIVNHAWNDGITTKQATCKEAGVKTFTCLDCGQTKTEVIDKLTTHTYGNWTVDNVNTHTHTCSVCGKNETLSHAWDNGQVTKIATCKDEGIKTYTCTDCGTTKTETIGKLTTHTWSKWTSVNAETHTRSCSVCSITETVNHNFVNEVCSDCGYTNIPASITGVQNATVDFDNSSISMFVDKTTATVNLSNMVKVSANSSWKLYTSSSNVIPTKIATLSNGENNYLIVVSSADGLYDNTYALTIYKSFEITVRYFDVYNKIIHTETADAGYLYNIEYTPQITGYTFNYWKLNNEQATSVTPYSDVNLYADCTVNNYTLTLNPNGGEVEQTEYTIAFDSSYTLPVTRAGYTFDGWYIDDVKITNKDGKSVSNWKYAENKTATARWTANPYKVNLRYDDYSHGSVSGSGTYDCDSSVTITATTNIGYTFIGWYDGDTLIDSNLTYTFTMPAQNVAYTAKWIKVTLVSGDTTAGTVPSLDNTYTAGESVTVTATGYIGYDFIGWYDDETLLTSGLTLSFDMPSQNKTYTAKWTVTDEFEPFNFTSTKMTCTITSIKDKSTTEIIVPNSVTNIGKGAFANCNNLENITIPFVGASKDGTNNTHFGYIFGADEAYDWSSNTSQNSNRVPSSLKTVVITGGTRIDDRAFYNCNNINSITILDSVTSIGSSAFYDCISLANVNYLGTIESWCNIQGLGSLMGAGTSSKTLVIDGKEIMGELIIPDTVMSISSGAFARTNITSVTFEENSQCTSIGNSAFNDCVSLTNITIPNSVTSIGSQAFYGCSMLTNVTFEINSQCTSIGSSAFNDCSNLQYNEYDNALYLGNASNPYLALIKAKSTDITSCTIHENTKIIATSAFYGCHSLANVNVTAIESWCNIQGIYNLMDYGSNSKTFSINGKPVTELVIPSTVTSIPSYAFRNTNITSVTFEENSQCKNIGESAFSACSSLTSIIIPNGVTSIGDYVFSYCSSLTSVTIPNGVTSIGDYAFENCSALTIYCETVDKPSCWDYKWNSWNKTDNTLKSYCPIIWDCNNTDKDENGYAYTVVDGIRYSLKDNVATVIRQPSNITEANIPQNVIFNGEEYTVTSIDNSAFSSRSKLISVTIPDSITVIGYGAFSGCNSLTSITIPFVGRNNSSSDSHFGYIFGASKAYDSSSYTSQNSNRVPSSLKTVVITGGTRIDDRAFYNCNNINSITILDSVTSIGNYAFYDCSKLTSVTISDSVTRISDDGSTYNSAAFYGCNNITSINYLGTIDDWFKISGLKNLMSYGASSKMFNLNGQPATKLVISSDVKHIPSYAFYNCSNITNIIISDSMAWIDLFTFDGCDNLQYNEYDNALYLGNASNPYLALIKAKDKTITSCTIHENTKVIASRAFYGCSSLKSVTIPNSVTSIGSSAFENSGLTKVIIPNSVTSIGSNAFYNCAISRIYCEANSEPSGWEIGWDRKIRSNTSAVVIEYTYHDVTWGYKNNG